MSGVGTFAIVLICLYCCVSWLLPRVLAWFLKRRFSIKVTIGRIGIPYMTLNDVHVSGNGFSVHADEIGFRSSLFSGDVTKLLAIVVRDVRINKDVGTVDEVKKTSTNDGTGTKSSITRKDLDFHNRKIPPLIITLAQFMAVHIYNVNTMILRAESPGWLVHATTGEIHLDGSIVHNAQTLLVNVNVTAATAKILRHASKKDNYAQTCLGDLSFGISMEASFVAQGPLSVERLFVRMHHTKAIINEGFYSFVQERKDTKSREKKSEILLKYPTNTWDILSKIYPIIPKNFDLKIEDSSLTGMTDSRTDFNSMLQCFQIKTCFASSVLSATGLPDISLLTQIEGLNVKCNKETVLILQKLALDGKLEDEILDIQGLLNTLSVTYNHKDVRHWVVSNFLRGYTQMMSVQTRRLEKPTERAAWLEALAQRWMKLRAGLEMWNVSALLRLSDEPHCASVGFSHLKVILEQLDEVRSCRPSWWFSRALLGRRHWSSELIVESLFCRLGNSSLGADAHLLKKYHSWGTPLFLGVALLKLRSHGADQAKLNAMLDTLRLEWSPPLCACIVRGFACVSEYRDVSLVQRDVPLPRQRGDASVWHALASCLVSVTLSNFNAFAIADKKVCLMARVDQSTLDSLGTKLTLVVDGAKLQSVIASKGQHTCRRSDELSSVVAHVKVGRASYKLATRELAVQLLEQVQVLWSPNLHLKALTLWAEVQSLRSSLTSGSVPAQAPAQVPAQPAASARLSLRLKGKVECGIALSSRHRMDITSDEVCVSSGPLPSVSASTLGISFDGAAIFSLRGLRSARVTDSPEVRAERQSTDNFTLPWNRTWVTDIDSFNAVFPYEHNFADAFQNEFVSVFKWLKLVHKKQRQPFNLSSPLPADMHIKIKEFLFEMSDDPFEVRLRDNYELLEDECKESVKRHKMLDAKVSELCKAHLLLPSGKVDELYASLNKKNAEIYVQRSKQMCRAAPARTRLFAWLMNDVSIVSLADPSIHGAENAVAAMVDIDPDSPWPEEGVEFTTLWCRSVSAACSAWAFQLRDFPQPLLDIRHFHVWGRLVGAEQQATRRAKRDVIVELGEPWGEIIVERSMTSLKFYHDFNCDVERFSYAFGPCWEPVIAQCNLSFEKIIVPSRDPSPPMPFWDKMRLLFHGRLTMCISQLTVLLHASLDPYNTTEEMELTWSNVATDWTNAKLVFKGELNVYVRTASKYDDCRLLHLPNLKLGVKLNWVCLGDPNDHHSVMPCAFDKLPEYSSNQEHDSFRAFRSQNLNVSIALETRGTALGAGLGAGPSSEPDYPVALLYGSTLRWFENLKLILSGVTRPTRRGRVFHNVRPRKKQLSRHYRKLHLLLGLHRFQVYYWMSFAMQRGFELSGGRISSSSEHTLTIVPVNDGLKHRPRAESAIVYMNCELNDAEIWLKSALEEELAREHVSMRQPVAKCYCLSVDKVSYGRETKIAASLGKDRDTPTHRLVVYDLKGAWTKSNRDVAFALFDTFVKTKQLKKNLSTEALKGFRGESSTPLKPRPSRDSDAALTPATGTGGGVSTGAGGVASPSPMSKLQSGHAASMLQQLIAEADNKAVVFSDDLSVQTRGQHLQGLAACHEDDVQHKNWLIVLVNSQVLLKGCETKGYVILSAAKAEILQRVHRPVWKDRTLVSKTTWVGSLECMQYYATVSAGEKDTPDENIMWLTVDHIQEKDSTVIAELPDLPDLVGSGQSVGGVISETVGASSTKTGENPPIQLQRIVSRCKCEFFYAGYGETSIDPGTLAQVPAPPPAEEHSGPWEKRERAVDAFTLMHHDLDVCTNSLQYAMILDVVNNLLLYVEPQRREASERLQRMRFQLQLHSVQDQRRPIQHLQNQVRALVSKLRRLEKESHLLQRAMAEEPNSVELSQEMEELENQVFECKELLTSQSEELDMMLSCYKETQISTNQRLATIRGDKPVTTVRANEICFKHAQWRLTEADGQLGIADLVLSNFVYTKNSKKDDSGEHLLELGYVRMTNLLPNQAYHEVLLPTEIQSNMPVDRKRAVRVFCREKAPVGGISVKEHFEINVVPITIGLTKKFFNTMLKFCFPERDPDAMDGDVADDGSDDGKSRKKLRKSKDTNFYVRIEQKDDVDKMKERAEKNKLFIYIKIPEVPVRVSYKGSKEKNIEDIRDFSLVIPTLEYHNVTWTWLDLLLAMKSDSRRIILPQAIKQKLQIKMNRTLGPLGAAEDGASPQEEDKARMLFGARMMPGDSKSLKKGIFKFAK